MKEAWKFLEPCLFLPGVKSGPFAVCCDVLFAKASFFALFFHRIENQFLTTLSVLFKTWEIFYKLIKF